jgi:hypothetical protein
MTGGKGQNPESVVREIRRRPERGRCNSRLCPDHSNIFLVGFGQNLSAVQSGESQDI